LISSFVRLLNADVGFQPGHVLASIIVPQGDAYKTAEQRAPLYRRILAAAWTLPGVESAGTVDALPFSGENNGASLRSGDAGETAQGSNVNAELDRVSAGYLETIGVRLLQGRWFREEDESNASNTAIVDEGAARRFWPSQDPIGKRLCIDCADGQPQNWKQVIGVVNSIRHYSLEAAPDPEVYVADRSMESAQFLVVRTRGRAGELSGAVRKMVASLDPNVPVYLSAEMTSLAGDTISDRRFTMAMLAITGILALVLAAAGVYAVVSYATSRRTQEIGIRMALGATRGNVQNLVLREGMQMALAGVASGLITGLIAIRLLRGVLAGVGEAQTATVLFAVFLVTAAALLACSIPARRAASVDPMTALRNE